MKETSAKKIKVMIALFPCRLHWSSIGHYRTDFPVSTRCFSSSRTGPCFASRTLRGLKWAPVWLRKITMEGSSLCQAA